MATKPVTAERSRRYRRAALVALFTIPFTATSVGAQPIEQRYMDQSDWLTYDRDNTGQRYSGLDQINRANVSRLVPKWMHQYSPPQRRTEATPLVRDGVMYLTAGAARAFAIDATTGTRLWQFDYPYWEYEGHDNPTWSRGFGLSGNRLYMGAADCHLIAIDSRNGALLWRSPVAVDQPCYGSAAAPIVAKDRVVIGIRGGDSGRVRGFIDAFNAETGEKAWRFYTVPAPGEPGSETWPDDTEAWRFGGGSPWSTGTYDPDLDLLYWPTGNPGPKDFDGRDREGDNLYTASVLALRPDDGSLAWHFQFTPHDEHDWDANQTPVLIDREWNGEERRLLVHPNRNSFLYLLDRETGEFLRATQFAKQNWADGFTPTGRPLARPEAAPSPTGALACPDIHGGTNWQAPTYHPKTGLLYVVSRDACGMYFRSGHSIDHIETGADNFLRAIDLATGSLRWEIPMPGAENREVTFAGAMATAGGLVFFGTRAGTFMAADAVTGELLWHFNTGGTIRASPITFLAGGQQYVAITTKGGVFAFGLFD